MSEYQQGKSVRKNSGGPIMEMDIFVRDLKHPQKEAVQKLLGYPDDYVRCYWLEGTERKHEYFSLDDLIDVDGQEGHG